MATDKMQNIFCNQWIGDTMIQSGFCSSMAPFQNLNSQKGGREGGLLEFIKLFFFSKAETAFLYYFCWQALINCASVGTKNLGTTEVFSRNPKNTTNTHVCSKNHNMYALVTQKIATYSHFCCESHNIHTLRSKKNIRTSEKGDIWTTSPSSWCLIILICSLWFETKYKYILSNRKH